MSATASSTRGPHRITDGVRCFGFTELRGSCFLALVVCFVLGLGLTACQDSAGRIDYERRISQLQRTIDEKDDALVAQRRTIDELQQRLDEARGFKLDLDRVFYPERLVIASLSGGYDADDRPGDDGVIVYLRPLDRYGDVVKVAGDIRIELLDLAQRPGERTVGRCVVDVDRAGEFWYGKLMTHHYAIRCPWAGGPPAHREITIRATFIDYLTQRVVSTQKTCEVDLPP